MAKVDMARDYYADLELPSTADIADIKKQFRKLALKYHPDRNPGREAEVNSKFQIIQSAHEILTNPEQKSRYDSHRITKVRYPTASGVRGNPWQDIGKQYPPPPQKTTQKRPPPPAPTRPRPTTGGSRYSNFAPKVPPSPKPAKDDPSDRVRAFESMRPDSRGKTSQPAGSAAGSQSIPKHARSSEPRPIPRTNSQRQKAEASFGNRRAGFAPASPSGDEPPVTNRNYFTTKLHTNLFAEAVSASAAQKQRRASAAAHLDPLSQRFQEATLDARQSTPYQTHGGEKTNPFEGANINRSRSTRAAFGDRNQPSDPVDETPPSSPQRRRSASVPDDSENAKYATQANGKPVPRFPFTSRADEQYRPRGDGGADQTDAFRPATANPATNGATSTKSKDDPTVYDSSHFKSYRYYGDDIMPLYKQCYAGSSPYMAECLNITPGRVGKLGTTSSEAQQPPLNSGHLGAFERFQFDTIHKLVNSSPSTHPSTQSRCGASGSSENSSPHDHVGVDKHTDEDHATSFTFSVDGDAFERPGPPLYGRSSADNINTRFAANGESEKWEFSAGGDAAPGMTPKRRARSAARSGRRSPGKTNGSGVRDDPFAGSSQTGEPESKQGQFDAGHWREQIRPEHFEPPPKNPSPTRASRLGKKPKPVRMTAGTAGLVDEDDDEYEYETGGNEHAANPGVPVPGVFAYPVKPGGGVDTSTAMDIDTPPPESTTPEAKNARNIPVEPSRPDWRAGDVDGVSGAVPPEKNGQAPAFQAHVTGSEDSEEFLASTMFSDFSKVEPFNMSAGGLGSFGDLKDNLPFQSKPSVKIPIEMEKPKPLHFPNAPVAPRPPPALVFDGMKVKPAEWTKYARSFHAYMNLWAAFNSRVTDHFAARRRQVEMAHKPEDFSWIESRGDASLREYLQWLEEDHFVRQKWLAACDVHEMHVKQFLKNRIKMAEKA